MSLFEKLNPEQKKAVEKIDGPLLILAGAGSGKTRVLTHRIANIIYQNKARPENILAVTFTNKAAREMRERALDLLYKLQIPIQQSPIISTFHSFCVQVLRSYIHLIGYTSDFSIYDRSDQLSLIKKIFKQLNLDTKQYSAQSFLSTITSSKIYGISPEEYLKEAVHNVDRKMGEVYGLYEKQMHEANALDFDDLLIKTILLFEKNDDVLGFYQTELKYILVDEYQDTSTIQYKLIHMLSHKHRNLCVVGDEDQSIYSWRGANIENILSFEKDYPEVEVIKLEENYRSTKTIVSAASEVIKNNIIRKEKTLFTQNSDGEKISAKEVLSEYEEGKFVSKTIHSLMQNGEYSFDDFAVFYRTNSQSRAIEEELRSHRIPYQIIGGVKFYDRMEIKDLISYFRLICNPNDDVSFLRIINVPTRGIGDVTTNKIIEYSKLTNQSLLKTTQIMLDEENFNSGTHKKLTGFVNTVQYLKVQLDLHRPSEFLPILLDHLQYPEYLKFEKPEDYSTRLENINELINVLVKFEKERGTEASIQQFLEEVALVSDIDEMDASEHSVKLMTLHISKGLEFPFVFIVGFEEGLFPSNQSSESLDPSLLEEERRLCYVGMTRAKEKLFLSFSRKRMVWGQEQVNPPSRFLKEIPEKFLEISSQINRPQNFYIKSSSLEFQPTQIKKDPFPNYEESIEVSSTEGFFKGVRVRHPSFGVGTIYETEGSGDEQKVTILFSNQKMKKFILKYARLERLN